MIRKDIRDYEGLYEITSDGEVFSKDRYVAGVNGSKRLLKGSKKSTPLCPKGHKTIQLSKDGKPRTFHLATIFAETFLKYNKSKHFLKYKDSNHLNISIDNIEVVDR